MSLHYRYATVGRHARSLLTASCERSSSRALILGPAQISNSHQWTQTRLSSTSSKISTLTPPWQFEDMTRVERRLFERWGPNYLRRMTPEQLEHVQKAAKKRAQLAVELEEEFGPEWYSIMRQATAIKDQQELAEEKQELGDAKEYRKMTLKEKKEVRRQFFDEKKATKSDRLREMMRKVVRYRPNF